MENYEQKYKEARGRAIAKIETYNHLGNTSAVKSICEIFPELRESEEEKIRKELISFLEGFYANKNKDRWLAWLEKQDANKEYVFRPLAGTTIENAVEQALTQGAVVLAFNGFYTPVKGKTSEKILAEYENWLEKQGNIDKASYDLAEKEKREFVGDGFIKCYADFQDFKEGETYWLEYLGNDNYNVRSDNLLGKTYHITPCQLYTIFKKQTWLEKQETLESIKLKEAMLDCQTCISYKNECFPDRNIFKCSYPIKYNSGKKPQDVDEKQGEQKPIEWSKQQVVNALTKWLTEKITPLHKKSLDGIITEREDMFKTALVEMRSFVNSPGFQIGKDVSKDWSEEDEKISNAIWQSIDFLCVESCGSSEDEVCDWLKSIKEKLKGCDNNEQR